MNSLILKIQWIGPSTNKLKHWGTYAKARKCASEALQDALKEQYPNTQIKVETPVEITLQAFMGRGKRAYDCTNYAPSLKMLEDAIVVAGILPNDTPEFVSTITIKTPVKYKDWYEDFEGTESFIVLNIEST